MELINNILTIFVALPMFILFVIACIWFGLMMWYLVWHVIKEIINKVKNGS